MIMSDSIRILTELYGNKLWALHTKVWKMAELLEMKCLRTIHDVTRVD